MAKVLVFLCNKGNCIGSMKLLFQRTFIQCTMVLPFILFVSFHLQITYRKVRNLRIGINKLVGKVFINLLHHAKSAICVISIISIIIDAPAIAYKSWLLVKLLMLYTLTNKFNKHFWYYSCLIVLMCVIVIGSCTIYKYCYLPV